MTYEYINKAIESPSGFEAACWRVTKVEIYPGQNPQILLTITGWKDIDAYLDGKAVMAVKNVSFDHAEEMPRYPAVFGDLLSKILTDPQFEGGSYATKDV